MSVDAFHDKLLQGERILWSGRPGQGILFSRQDIFLVPFSLMWGGFALFWEYMVLNQSRVPFFMKLWGVPFVLVGVFFIFGRFWLDSAVRARTYYAVTDCRVLIARTAPFTAFTALGLNQIPALELVDEGRGRGTIYFAPPPIWGRSVSWAPSLDARPKFIAVDNAQILMTRISERSRKDNPSGNTPPAIGGRFWPSAATSPGRPPALFWVVPSAIGGLFVWQALWNTVLCFGYGGADVRVAQSFATTQTSFDRGDRTPVTRFAPRDTAMALVVVNWPDKSSGAGSHRILWNWYRDGGIVRTYRRCHMHFDQTPFTLWTWQRLAGLGGGHYRVDTLVDGQAIASTEFDVDAPPPGAGQQGALVPQSECG